MCSAMTTELVMRGRPSLGHSNGIGLDDFPRIPHLNSVFNCRSLRSRVVRLPQTVFFETYAFTNIFPDKIIADEWENYDYVGTVSWKAPLKFMENFRFGKLVMSSIVKRAPDDADVIALVGQHLTNYTMLEKASQAHPRFKEVWEGLLGAFNKYTPEEISTEGMTPMLCNYWLARPQHAIKFIDFMKKAHHLMETLPSIQEPLWSNALYWANKNLTQKIFGLDYYAYHPFVLERLTPFFFNSENLNVFLYMRYKRVWNIQPGNDSALWDKALSLRLQPQLGGDHKKLKKKKKKKKKNGHSFVRKGDEDEMKM